MSGVNEKAKHAAQVLRRLDEIGAINLNVLVSKASEVASIAGMSLDDVDGGICYPFMMHIGPRGDIDVVSVVNQLTNLGFEVKPNGLDAAGLRAKA